MLPACFIKAQIQITEQPRPASTMEPCPPSKHQVNSATSCHCQRISLLASSSAPAIIWCPLKIRRLLTWPRTFYAFSSNLKIFKSIQNIRSTCTSNVHTDTYFHPTACRFSVKAARPNVSILHIPTEYRDGVPRACFCHWIYNAERRDKRTRDESSTQESCLMGRGVIGELVGCPLYACLI